MNRRQFLHTVGATATAVAVPNLLAAEAKSRRTPVVDTHTHCFAGAGDAQFPYHERAPYKPEKPAPPEQLLKLMDGAGVDFAIVVHPEPYQDDHRYLEHCLAVGKKRLKGTVLVFADRPGSIEKLPDLAKRLPVVTARIHGYGNDRLPPFGKPELRRLWQLASDHGLALQLHFQPRHAPGFEPLIREFKQTRVIVDHLGRPFQGTPPEHDRVMRWSDFPNVVMKLSSFPAPEAREAVELPLVIRRLAGAFGADRLIYGGGFNEEATAESYRNARERLAKLLDFLSPEARARVLGGNAARLFGFPSVYAAVALVLLGDCRVGICAAGGRDAALRRHRRRAERQTTEPSPSPTSTGGHRPGGMEGRLFISFRSVAPKGNEACASSSPSWTRRRNQDLEAISCSPLPIRPPRSKIDQTPPQHHSCTHEIPAPPTPLPPHLCHRLVRRAPRASRRRPVQAR